MWVYHLLCLLIKCKYLLLRESKQQRNLEVRHPCCVCNIQVQCKEVKNTTSSLSVNHLTPNGHYMGRTA